MTNQPKPPALSEFDEDACRAPAEEFRARALFEIRMPIEQGFYEGAKWQHSRMVDKLAELQDEITNSNKFAQDQENKIAEMRFELEAKQRPLGEQVLELTMERQKLLHELSRRDDCINSFKNTNHYTENIKLKAERDQLTARVAELERELSAWKQIEEVSGRTRQEIYGMSNQLKKGQYGKPPLPDIPSCSMVPAAVKMHDEICDALEARAYNEHDVCTASVGIWAAIGACEKLFQAERDTLKTDLDAARDALVMSGVAKAHYKSEHKIHMAEQEQFNKDSIAKIAELTAKHKAALAECDRLVEALNKIVSCKWKCPSCGHDEYRLPDYDYAFPFDGSDRFICEKCYETDEPEPEGKKIRALLEQHRKFREASQS